MADQPAPPNRFKPEMPRIPGVNDQTPRSLIPSSGLIILALAILAVLLGGFTWHLHASAKRRLAAAAAAAKPLPDAQQPVAVPPPPPSAPGPVATLEELARPWAAKKFICVRPDTHAAVTAMVIRLPGIAGDRSSAYWGFALTPPFGQCDLDYVTDVKELAARYGYSANHPMLAAACSGSLYDPTRMGSIGNGVWARGEVAQGPGIRPPTAIRIQVAGHSVIADRIE